MSLDFDSARLPNPNLREEHHEWRTQLRKFIDAEIMPYAEDWDEAGHIPIELWPKAAAVGLLGLGYPEEFGGTREGIDSWHNWIANEELARIGVGGIPASLMVHGIGLPPVINWGSQALKERVAPPVLAGEKHIALGITEPGGGSDVAQLATTAVRDGDHYIVNGSKTYITGGMRANWVSTAVRTGGEGAGGVSMLLIPTDAEGFSRTQLDRKQGWWASDTATLYFRQCAGAGGKPDWRREQGLSGDHDQFQWRAHGHGRGHGGAGSCLPGGGGGVGPGAQDLWQAPGGSPGHPPQDCPDEAETECHPGLYPDMLRVDRGG